VTLTLSGTGSGTVTSDGLGNFVFSGIADGSYTVTPSKSGYTFTPASAPVTVAGANVSGINFTAAPIVISGTIGVGADGVAVTVTLSGSSSASTTTNSSGGFTFSGVANGSYTVTPTKTGFTFTPSSRSVVMNGASATGLDFTATATPTWKISGTISPSSISSGGTVTLSGAASATTTVDATGTYSFAGLINGAYTVTPTKSAVTFAPVSRAVTISGANVTADFTAQASPLSIDATISFGRSNSSTTIASGAFSTTAGNELLLAFVGADNNVGTTTVSGISGAGLTWQLVRRTNTQRGTSEIWRAFAPAALSNVTVTATLSQSVAAAITVVTFKGVDTSGTAGSGAIGATGSGSAASGAPTATLTTTRANSLVIGVGNDWDRAAARTLGANQTMVSQYLATVGDTIWVQMMTNLIPAAGTVSTINDTAPTNDKYNLTICEVLAAP
jgi:hypothetical protein